MKLKKIYWPTKQWQTEDPAVLGMDPEKLLLLDSTIKSDYSNINGIVIVRNGYIAYERYYHGYGPEDTHHVASVTKSVLSALIGIAIDKGHIKSVDQKVLDFFPEYVPDTADGVKQEITLRHLLTMTVPYPFEDWHEPLDKLCEQPDWIQYTLNMLGQKGKLGDFKYSTAGAHLLSAILTRTTGKNARDFANDHLFRPIGMKVIPDYKMNSYGFEDLFGKNVRGWVEDPKGNSTGGWGLTLSPRDMARFGFLYLNKGIWDNHQVISKAWIKKSISMNANNYGFLWWLHQEDGIFAYLAMGDGGNMICCVPDKDLVVTIASQFAVTNPQNSWTLVKECIIPALKA